MDTQNGGLEDDFPFQRGPFSGPKAVSFRGSIYIR